MTDDGHTIDVGPVTVGPYIPGWQRIRDERLRQIHVEGWTDDHDDTHRDHDLSRAAECYLAWGDAQTREAEGSPPVTAQELVDDIWPWHPSWWKPSADPIRNLEKAGALIAAEIDRLQRASAPTSGTTP